MLNRASVALIGLFEITNPLLINISDNVMDQRLPTRKLAHGDVQTHIQLRHQHIEHLKLGLGADFL